MSPEDRPVASPLAVLSRARLLPAISPLNEVVVSDWAEVGEWGMIAEGAVVPQSAVVPAARIVAGVPARLLERAVDDEYRTAWLGFKQTYAGLCERYREGFGR